MNKINMWLKSKIRKWLGLGEAFIGVDVGVRDESCIVVASKLNDGTVRIIDARFGSWIEIERFVKECQERYGVPHRDTLFDYPVGWRPPSLWR